jgi:Mrp family chromosome partitioning ATPase
VSDRNRRPPGPPEESALGPASGLYLHVRGKWTTPEQTLTGDRGAQPPVPSPPPTGAAPQPGAQAAGGAARAPTPASVPSVTPTVLSEAAAAMIAGSPVTTLRPDPAPGRSPSSSPSASPSASPSIRPRAEPADDVRPATVRALPFALATPYDARLILLADPDSPRAASFRVLRHRLSAKGDPSIIAVTSAEGGAGKTTCAVNLALALSECDRARVLLVEANWRTPQLAALFGMNPPECFADQVALHATQRDAPWSVVAINHSLHVAAVRPVDGKARALLDAPAFSFAVRTLARADYDYLVIDTPPVLGAADVNLVEDCADGVLLVARAGATTSRNVRRALEQLSPARLLGLTLLDG